MKNRHFGGKQMDELEQAAYDFMNQDSYQCFLNGSPYGRGSLEYIQELFTDYVVTCKMYGHKQCDFKIVKI